MVITKVSFVVHVVERVETVDWIARNRFTSQYSYHHGYFDGAEREFRGFGMAWQNTLILRLSPLSAAVIAFLTLLPTTTPVSHVPPVLTRMWFHTGAFVNHKRISKASLHTSTPARRIRASSRQAWATLCCSMTPY